jgi:hypothetical protein
LGVRRFEQLASRKRLMPKVSSSSSSHSVRRLSPALFLLIFGFGYAGWSLCPSNLLVGKWVDDSGEVWEIRRDRSIETNNQRWPHRSYRWNLYPIAIHLFYEPGQRAPHGPFTVMREWNTFTLQPAWKTGGRAQPWVFHRVSDPFRYVLPATLIAAIAAFYWWPRRRNDNRTNT